MTHRPHHPPKAAPYVQRAILFVRADEPLPCPAGHRVNDPLVLHLGVAFRCATLCGGVECGRLFFVIGSEDFRAPDGTPAVLSVEVTLAEVRAIKDQRMSPARIAQFLGLTSNRSAT